LYIKKLISILYIVYIIYIFGYSYIFQMQNVNFNILNENDKQISQPKSINIELMMHQKTIVQKMLEIEQDGIINIKNSNSRINKNIINIPFSSAEIKTNFAVIADKVGSGKTLSIVTLISVKKSIADRDIDMGSSQLWSIKIKPQMEKIKTNLILVPHKLIPQWSETFEKYAKNLNVLTITKNADIDTLMKDKVEFIENFNGQKIKKESEILRPDEANKYDVILIGDTMYRRFYKGCANIQFNRLIIDEADTIKLPNDMSCGFKFMWLITGTPTGLFHSDKHFISNIFKRSTEMGVDQYFVFKNDENFIEQSIILPHPKRLKIKCLSPVELSIVKDIVPPHILQMINAGNSDQAIKELNCNVDTNENILQVITKNIKESIGNKLIELEAEQKKFYPPTAQAEHEKKINLIQNQIKKLEEKIIDIKKKIEEHNDEICPICMGEISNPTIVNCCKSLYCFECLAVSLGELKSSKCPKCAQRITKSDIHIISQSNDESNEKVVLDKKYELKDKLDVLVDLINNKPNGSFMVFANFVETFAKIRTKLEELKIPYHILKGQASVVKNFIEDFKEKRVRVLMLNAEFFGAGMNLQMTTDLVMFHRFKPEMEEQIIGRAQRLGRKDPLNVYYLLHDNESDEIENKFKFEDQGPIHYLDWLENNKDVEPKSNIQVDKDEPDNQIYTIKMINSDEEEIVVGTNSNSNTNKNVSKSDDEIKLDNILPMKNKSTKSNSNIDDSNIFVKGKIVVENQSDSECDDSKCDDSDCECEIESDEEICFEEFEVIN
jgi:SNF2 family DNA or RNA helicase